MTETTSAPLTQGAQRLVQAAGELQGPAPSLGTYHWLLALLQRHGPMAESMAEGVTPSTLRDYLFKEVAEGRTGDTLSREVVLAQAGARAQARGRAEANERDVAAVILQASGYGLREEDHSATAPTFVSTPTPPTSGPAAPWGAATYAPRNTRPTPALEQFGRDLTAMAAQGRLSPVVGREIEVELVVETLCRRTKRNPVLVGPAGVGKTAIVEGLAQRVVRGAVPAALRGVRVIEIQPSSLIAGAGIVGELNERMKGILQEAEGDGIILFIDEVHTLMGAGGPQGTGDVASLFKPALARGDLACIAATTDVEYRRFIETDGALERRFQPVRVQELSRDGTMAVLESVRNELQRLRGVRVDDDILTWLIDFAAAYLRNRTFPDKAIDVLEQCVAHAVTEGKEEVRMADAEAVAQRLVGMPLGVENRLQALRDQLHNRGLLTTQDTDALLNRLAVTMRRVDLRSERPNAVVLMAGEAAREATDLATAIAGALLGGENRVVFIDFSRFTQPSDITMLIGAPPGYVGYADDLPIHALAQMPWCVLLAQSVDACHPAILHVFTQALSDGFLTQSDGKPIYLSDTVVLLTTASGETRHRPIGFLPRQVEEESPEGADEVVPPTILDQVDLTVQHLPVAREQVEGWLEASVLADLAARFQKYGLTITCDGSVVRWLVGDNRLSRRARDWERLVDERIMPALVPYLTKAAASRRSLQVTYADGSVHVTDVTERQGEDA